MTPAEVAAAVVAWATRCACGAAATVAATAVLAAEAATDEAVWGTAVTAATPRACETKTGPLLEVAGTQLRSREGTCEAEATGPVVTVLPTGGA
mmetsp:Transcript_63081/g.128565  ORF Transcript_63081/g.128565 Transcript_63081/m.128565 type:complete len:94 (+) Transcript_63081:319-600(+)